MGMLICLIEFAKAADSVFPRIVVYFHRIYEFGQIPAISYNNSFFPSGDKHGDKGIIRVKMLE